MNEDLKRIEHGLIYGEKLDAYDRDLIIRIINEQQKRIIKQQEEIVMLEGAVKQDDETKTRYANEIGELISLVLWVVRRLSHQQHKDFAYDELEKITAQKFERV